MTEFSLLTPVEVAGNLAARAKSSRLALGWKQATLAQRSGVSLGSLRRFESTGQVSLQNLLKIALALHRLDDFDSLLQRPLPSSMAELEEVEEQPSRKRGRL